MKHLRWVFEVITFLILVLFLNGCYTSFGTTKRDNDVDLDEGIGYSDYQDYDEYDEYSSEPYAYQEYDTVYVEEDPMRFDPDRQVVIRDVQYRPKYIREIYYTYDYDPYYDEYYYDPGPNISFNLHIGSYWYPPSWWYRPYYWGIAYHPYWWWDYGYATIYPPYYGPYWGCGYPYPVVYWPGPYYYHNNPSYDYKEIAERKKRDWRKREPRVRQQVRRGGNTSTAIADNSRARRTPARNTSNVEQVKDRKRNIPIRDNGSVSKRKVRKDNVKYTNNKGKRQVEKVKKTRRVHRSKRYVKTRKVNERTVQKRNAPRKVFSRNNSGNRRKSTVSRKTSSNKRYTGRSSSVSKRDNSQKSKPNYTNSSKRSSTGNKSRSVKQTNSNSGSSRSSGMKSSSRSSSSRSSGKVSSSRGSSRKR